MGKESVRVNWCRIQGWLGSSVTDLGEFIAIGKENGEDGASTKQVLDFEGVDVWIVGRFVVVDHQIHGVG